MFKGKKHILSTLFDVRPVTERGDLDMEKIDRISRVLDLKEKKTRDEDGQREKAVDTRREKKIPLTEEQPETDRDLAWRLSVERESIEGPKEMPTKEEILAELEQIETYDNLLAEGQVNLVGRPAGKSVERDIPESAVKPSTSSDSEPVSKAADQKSAARQQLSEQPLSPEMGELYFPEVASQKYSLSGRSAVPSVSAWSRLKPARPLSSFLLAGLLIALTVPGLAWLSQGLAIKDNVLSSSLTAYQNLLSAQQSLEGTNWQQAIQNFGLAQSNLLQAEEEIKNLGQLNLAILEKLPGGQLVSSGNHLIKVGQNLARAGQGLASAINSFSSSSLFNLFGSVSLEGSDTSASKSVLTDLIADSQADLEQALIDIRSAQEELKQVEAKSLPAEIQESVSSLEDKLPLIEEILRELTDYSAALLDILGRDNPRQYLLIFQNSSELRATGGFIGTYGLLTLDRGSIKDLFIEGIFNADGQLREKIIPPRPIQKISTAWSMHDANWFADFPTSAEKVAWFYEKTGGPTVDGVIGLTPTVVERLLELTGPIAMPEYQLVLKADNFVELVQCEVEIDYDKKLNQPKKILADFAPRFIEAINQLSADQKKEALTVIFDCLKEKHILVYFKDNSLEKLAVDQDWAGQLLTTEKDYLSVVSSNINGYKTDRVIRETIEHQAEIQVDGSVIDTLTITRRHQGGAGQYDWWNQVNANYLRVYLPEGSRLISADGQTRETYQPPIDYQEQSFQADSLVESIESKMRIDSQTGTRIFEENGKTVFGNWLYVSPGQTVKLTYRYELPFKINLTKSSDSYSLLVQKQSGSSGSQFSHQLNFPADWQISWQYPDHASQLANSWQLKTDLSLDRFLGVTFEF